MTKTPVLAVIVPCYIEAPVVETTNGVLLQLLEGLQEKGKVGPGSFLLYVDDRSSDNTWEVISRLSSPKVKAIRLSRHCGHQMALLAGMEYALPLCDVCVTIDADLQDDPRAIAAMLDEYEKGADVVYGVREERSADSLIKRTTAEGFYKTMRMLGVDCVPNHADFRLMSARAVGDLLEFGERNVFLRGMVPQIGYVQSKVYYTRRERKAGKTKYPLMRMIDFAIDGITSFSVRPVRMLFVLGVISMAIGVVIGIYALIRHYHGETIEGWTSLMLSLWFCTGLLLTGMGITGEYVGKIYIEVKKRPRYKIAETL